MARQTSRAQQAPEPEPVVAPPFWVADRPLPVGTEMGDAALPARAFNPGDRVPVEHVDRYGWREYVHAPDGDWPPPEPAPESVPQTGGSDDSAGDAGQNGSD